MTEERRQRILAIAEELEAQGLPATNSAVYGALGHRGHVVAVMKERRAQQAGGVAVAEEEEDEPEATRRQPPRFRRTCGIRVNPMTPGISP